MPSFIFGASSGVLVLSGLCLRDVGSLAPALLLYEGLLPGASLHMPTLSGASSRSTCLSGLRRASSFLQFLPLLHRGLLLGTSCAHAHFISGRPVEYLSVWFSVVRLSFCGSCLLLYTRASSWSLFLRMPALSWGIQWSAYLSGLRLCDFFLATLFWASSWVIIGLIPPLSLLQFVGAFFRTYFFKPRYPVHPGSWLSPEGSVSLAFFVGLFKDKVYPLSISSLALILLSVFRSDLQKAVCVVPF